MMMVYLYFAIYDKYNTITFLGPLNCLIMICNYQSGATTSNDINLSYYIPTYVTITVETVTYVGDHQHGDGHI